MAMKCGNCQKNRIANRIHAPADNEPRAAAQPISGGSAPGMAPTAVASVVRVLSGVYTPREDKLVARAMVAARAFTVSASHAVPRMIVTAPNKRTSPGLTVPAGSGREEVLRITAS